MELQRLPDAVSRVPRGFLESPSFRADWRSAQVEEFYIAAQNRIQNGSYPAPPAWEDDRIVREYYRFRAVGSGMTADDTNRYRWVTECRDTNRTHGFGSRIKGLYLAKMMPHEISEELKIPTHYVETFLDLFFDVRSVLHNEAVISNIIRPFGAQAASGLQDHEKMDRIILIMGYYCGADAVRAFANFNVGAQRDLVREFDYALTANAYLAGAGYAMLERASRAPNMKDLDRALSLKRTRAEEMKAGATRSPGALGPGEEAPLEADAAKQWMEAIAGDFATAVASGGKRHEDDIPSIDEIRDGSFDRDDIPGNITEFKIPDQNHGVGDDLDSSGLQIKIV